jgi:hypothetical protein
LSRPSIVRSPGASGIVLPTAVIRDPSIAMSPVNGSVACAPAIARMVAPLITVRIADVSSLQV